jgi:hypothetical protein
VVKLSNSALGEYLSSGYPILCQLEAICTLESLPQGAVFDRFERATFMADYLKPFGKNQADRVGFNPLLDQAK